MPNPPSGRHAGVTPLARYEADLAAGALMPDAGQRRAVTSLERVYAEALEREAREAAWHRRALRRFMPASRPSRGLYLWGGVGRGKSHLVDMFYDCLPMARKRRVHFHRFMQSVHSELAEFAGARNPLQRITSRWAGDVRALCLDEFLVHDIADAMLLSGLLEGMLGTGACMVITSNQPPGELYQNGLQRERFLPAIALIERQLEVLEIDSDQDYRLRALTQVALFFDAKQADADRRMRQSFERLAPTAGVSGAVLHLLGRDIETRCMADDVVWLEFSALCGSARSAHDYVELSSEFHAVLIGNVPQMNAERDDEARRFVSLVDALYDCCVKVVMSSVAALDSLYAGTALAREFQRTTSRLREMQSQEYLERPHRI